jgi:hypothetical protein
VPRSPGALELGEYVGEKDDRPLRVLHAHLGEVLKLTADEGKVVREVDLGDLSSVGHGAPSPSPARARTSCSTTSRPGRRDAGGGPSRRRRR